MYQTDIGDIYDDFENLYKNHLYLHEIQCKKCGEYAITNPVPYLEAINYTSDYFAKVILCYNTDRFDDDVIRNDSTGIKHGIKHKHKKIYGYSPYTTIYGGQGWFGDDRCAYCNRDMVGD